MDKFYRAQHKFYEIALNEIRSGKKTSHWIWFIFPQLKGLGFSEMTTYYGLNDLQQAATFLSDPYLGGHLVEITTELLNISNSSALEIFGSPDDQKLHSSMTLFALVPKTVPCFEKVLQKYFNGKPDIRTLQLLGLL